MSNQASKSKLQIGQNFHFGCQTILVLFFERHVRSSHKYWESPFHVLNQGMSIRIPSTQLKSNEELGKKSPPLCRFLVYSTLSLNEWNKAEVESCDQERDKHRIFATTKITTERMNITSSSFSFRKVSCKTKKICRIKPRWEFVVKQSCVNQVTFVNKLNKS